MATHTMQDDDQSSVLYSILPSVFQSRLPRIPSIRRSVSLYGSGTRREAVSTPGSSPKSRPGTPYEEESGNEGEGAVILSTRAGGDVLDFFRSGSDGGQLRQRKRPEIIEQKSGVGWKYAGQGLNLLSLAFDEGSTLLPSVPESTSSFARQLYIHSVTYLLRGLPSDMTPEETLSIRSSLPVALAQPIHITASPSSSGNQSAIHHPPSILHKTLAGSIIQLFVVIGLLLPYLKLLLRRMHQYEKQHHIVEKALHGSVGVFDEMGKKGLGVSAAIWSAGIGDTIGWFLEEVGAGVREGVEGGLTKVTATPATIQ